MTYKRSVKQYSQSALNNLNSFLGPWTLTILNEILFSVIKYVKCYRLNVVWGHLDLNMKTEEVGRCKRVSSLINSKCCIEKVKTYLINVIICLPQFESVCASQVTNHLLGFLDRIFTVVFQRSVGQVISTDINISKTSCKFLCLVALNLEVCLSPVTSIKWF